VLADQWWEQRTHPFGSLSPADELTLAWRRARLAHDAIWRWHTELGVTALPVGSDFGTGDQEPLVLASPLCTKSSRAFLQTNAHDVGWSRPAQTWDGVERRDTTVGTLDGIDPWRSLRMQAFQAAGFAAVRGPGHEGCFHRRAKDITPVTWTIALLLRTYGGRMWGGPVTWDALFAPTTNDHTYSAVGPALGMPEDLHHDPAALTVPADGRAIVVYTTQQSRGVVLTNDGHAWINGADVDFGSEWRSGEDLSEIARKLAERAQLPTAPIHG